MLYSFIFRHKKLYLAAVCATLAVFAVLFSKAKFKEDVSEMLPDSLKTELALFQNSPLSNKLFVVVESNDGGVSSNAAQTISQALENNTELNLRSPKAGGDFLLSYYHFAPNIWNEDMQKKTEALLDKKVIASNIEENFSRAFSPGGMFFRDFVTADPPGLLTVFAEELKNLDVTNSFEADGGFISSDNGKKILLIFDYPKNALDLAFSKKLKAAFDEIKSSLPGNVNAFFTGAPRYALENNELIVRDIKKISAISLILMAVLFFVFLRDGKAVLIYFTPPAVIAAAAVITSFVFNGISGITVGFGAVLMGLSVDYCVYAYFALKVSQEKDRFDSMRKIFKPVAVSALTSILTFSLLLLSDIGVFRQVAVFCAAGLTAAFLTAFFIAPLVFDCRANRRSEKERNGGETIRRTELSPSAAIVILLLIFASAAICFKYVKFDISLDSLNTVSAEFEKDKEIFEQITGNAYNNNEFLFVFGNTKEEALENNGIISRENKGLLKLYRLFPDKKTKEQNVLMWKKFWTPDKIAAVKKEVEKASKKYGVKPGVFDNFYKFLEAGTVKEGEAFGLERFYNPVIEINGRYAFTNILPKGGKVVNAQNIETSAISNYTLQEKIINGVSSSFYKIMIVLLLCSFTVLALFLKNAELAVLSLVPVICGVCVFFTAAAVLKIEVNLFGLFAVPLLMGLGIDYAVFIIYKIKGDSKLHPLKAAAIAALSTLIGFGSLMAAQHKVLFIIGFMVFTGILTAILVSVFILPAFLRNSKSGTAAKILFLVLAVSVSFSACAKTGGDIRYNAVKPGFSASSGNKTSMFYGSYMDSLPFKAIAVEEEDGVRAIIMNDLGVKIQDMKIKKDGGTDVYFHIPRMPESAVERFAEFFKELFINETNENIRNIGGKLFFFYQNEPVLWATKI
ncbi:MAG: MMPL family transporter [Endomicrobium sp.]|jgi:predicted exporter|nr:MMPL family transporter [Endomicrobium sp.]